MWTGIGGETAGGYWSDRVKSPGTYHEVTLFFFSLPGR